MLTQAGLISQSSMTQFVNTLCDSLKNVPAHKDKSGKGLGKKVPSIKKFDRVKEIADSREEKADNPSSSRKRVSTVVPLHKMSIVLPFENTEFTSLGWDEYQEIKLILYSVNFKGKECISLDELNERSQ